MALIFILISIEGLFSQSAMQQNTFYELTFGSKPEEIPGKLQLDLTISYGLKYYKYKSKNHKEIYGQKVHEMTLGFQDDLLVYIDIYFSKLGPNGFRSLTDSLEVNFGKAKSFEAVEKGIIDATRWEENNTTLDFYRYGDGAIDLDDRNKSVISISRPSKQ
ncbi:MAG: hypothetical protein AAF693_16520 [Bacteroidota bacterium]